MRKNSIKNTRINGEVQKVLSEIIRGEIKDPRINPMTSVVMVEVAPDLKTCKAFISVLGDEESQKSTLAGLKSAVGYIRRQLAESPEEFDPRSYLKPAREAVRTMVQHKIKNVLGSSNKI